jgi:hypothetical protein
MRAGCVLAGLTGLMLAASAAEACEPPPGYQVPTNFELVQHSDHIVVATVIAELPKSPASWDDWGRYVLFRSDEVLKGDPPRYFAISGMVGEPRRNWTADDLAASPRAGEIRHDYVSAPVTWDMKTVQMLEPPPSNPDTLIGANIAWGMGACIRYLFAQNKAYVMLLVNGVEPWAPSGVAQEHEIAARVNEDYFGPDSLWMQTIRSYLDIQKRPVASQPGALRARISALGRMPASTWRDEQVADAERTLHPDALTRDVFHPHKPDK